MSAYKFTPPTVEAIKAHAAEKKIPLAFARQRLFLKEAVKGVEHARKIGVETPTRAAEGLVIVCDILRSMMDVPMTDDEDDGK